MKDLFKSGIYVCVISIILNIMETAYFGYHRYPSCIEEERWDVGLAILFEFGLCMAFIGFYKNKSKQ